jgi:hypothetical protein
MRRQILVSPLLRLALRLDALISLAAGAATLALPSSVAAEVGAPSAAVTAVGVFMLGYGLLAGVLGACRRLPRWLVLVVVVGNAVWAIDSLLLFATGWIGPSPFGVALIVAQAVLVAFLSALQGAGLRRSERLPA